MISLFGLFLIVLALWMIPKCLWEVIWFMLGVLLFFCLIYVGGWILLLGLVMML